MRISTSELPSLGIIGVGLMGTALAERAAAAGFRVVGYDLNRERSEALSAVGGEFAQSPREVAEKADWLVYSVMTTGDVLDSLEAVGDGLTGGQLIIDCSTGTPDQMAALAVSLEERGVTYLDATIAGNSEETRRGEVLALVGGNKEDFDRCQPFFQSFAKESFHLGPAGSGARMKLVFNLVLGLHRAVLAEALQFAGRAGVDPRVALEILKSGTTYSYVMDNKGEKMLNRDFSVQAKLEQHLKDVNLILELGSAAGAALPLSTLHRQLLDKLVDAGDGALDNSVIIRAFDNDADHLS